ncbi:transcriptional regulator [Eikenella longinqua]|uniref:Transcriptional regulator n=1 Tax=Eikenella longinqua TaxID=1795827 RepID=A0A1A9RXB5_9NEIS|nr:TetR family transcriptional regulator [Eikenella longinqua]OAM27564.1 transcriptional regulator [Eikenella longinqua]
MRKTKVEAQKTRNYLLRAALDTFYLRGISRSSLNEIAQTAGVTRGALYWHFKNKEDLFEGLFQQVFAELSNELAHDVETQSPDIWESFEVATINMFQRLETDETMRKFCNIIHLKCEYTEQNHSVVKIMRSYQDMWQRLLTDTLTLSLQKKQLPEDLNVNLAVVFMMSVISGLMNIWLNMPEQFSIGKTAPHIIRAAMGALKYSPDLCSPSGKQLPLSMRQYRA